ncbi:MAG: hypothetical protein WCR08_07055 [Gammaproteobacteria bacterium]
MNKEQNKSKLNPKQGPGANRINDQKKNSDQKRKPQADHWAPFKKED